MANQAPTALAATASSHGLPDALTPRTPGSAATAACRRSTAMAGKLPMVRIDDRAAPAELGVARGVEHAPIQADAAFDGLPRLVEGFDDVVVDAAAHRRARRSRAAPAACSMRPGSAACML